MNRYDELQDNGPNIWQAKLVQRPHAKPHPPPKAISQRLCPAEEEFWASRRQLFPNLIVEE